MTVINGEKRPLPIVEAITLLLVAGGGGGGGPGGGGGGAGGLLMLDNYAVSDGVTYAISIGAGGAGTTLATATGANGSNSEFNQPFQELSYSNYFDGSGDYLSFPGNAAFSITTSTTPFTVEFWAYPTAARGVIFTEQFVGAANNTMVLIIALLDSSGSFNNHTTTTNGRYITFGWYTGSAYGIAAVAREEIQLNQWSHVVVTFTGSTSRIYINGINVTNSTPAPSTTWGITGTGGDGWFIGKKWAFYTPDSGEFYTGYLSNFRFVKGTAVYTSEFIPPTSPLTSIANTSLLTCQSSTIKDNSTNNFTITKNGDVAVTTVTPFDNLNTMELTNASTYFDGSDSLTLSSNAAFDFGSGAFTIEMWIYPTAAIGSTQTMLIGGDSTGFVTFRITDSALLIDRYNQALDLSGSTSNPPNVWAHIAFVRDANTLRIYKNGVEITNGATSQSYNLGSPKIAAGSGLGSFTGYLSNLRIVKGTAVYTANFTPSTTPLTAVAGTSLLTCQNNIIVDNSTNNFTITKNGDVKTALTTPFNEPYTSDLVNATYFDGNGDWLTISNNAALNISGGDFTLEAWIYVTALPGLTGDSKRVCAVVSFSTTTVNQGYHFIINFTDNILALYSPGTGNGAVGSFTFALNTWYHVAATRLGSTDRLFVNGTSLSLTTNTFNNVSSASGTLKIGAERTFTNYNLDLPGYISNLRIVKGTALYTTNFTPPTQPLTAVPGTSLLTCQDKAFIDNSVNNFTITKNGDTAPAVYRQTSSTVIENTYEHSTVFNGSSTYLFIPPTDIFNFATSTIPLTVEAWIYIKGTGGTIVTEGWPGSGSITFCLTLGPSGNTTSNAVWFGYYNGSSWITAAYATTLVQNTWYHLAGVYTGTSLNLYVNGILAATTGASALPTAANHGIQIGRKWDTSATPYFNGYIKDVRIVKGTAVYTSNFIPSREPLTAIPNTILLTCQNSEILDNSTYNHALVQYGPIVTTVESPNYSLKAIGGGGGGTYNGGASLAGVQGGSGGGAPGTGSGQGRAAGANIIDQGNVGGAGTATDGSGSPGGGGGMSLPGGAASPNIAGYGGPGYNWQINQYGYSTYFNGTSDYLTFDSLVTSQGVFGGSAAFTFEAWVYPLGSSWMLITNINTTSSAAWWEIFHSAADGLVLHFGFWGSSSASAKTGGTQQVPNYAWTHIVIQRRADNTVDIYFDGKLQTVTNGFYGAYIGFNLTANTIAKIGYGGYFTAGPMIVSNFRFTKNQQIYTGNFVPSTSPLTSLGANTKLLCCQGNDFVNRSDNEFTLTTSGSPKTLSVGPFTNTTPEYSVYFDGTGDFLSVASNDNIPKANESYTIECWFYFTGATQTIVSWGEAVANKATGLRTNTAGNGILHYWWTNDLDTGNIELQRNSWNHVAAQFNGTTRTIYVNGVLKASDSPTGHNVTVTNNLKIGAGISSTELAIGYISNLRIVKDTAVYPSNFTPSTAPLTAIPNTVLLTCTGTSITDLSPNNYTITVNGNTRVAINDPFVEYQYIGGGGAGLALQGGGGGVLGATDRTVSALPNTGSGGGGYGGSGGSGVAIIKYPKTYRQPTETTGDVEIIETDTDRIYKWNGSGTIKF